MSGSKSLLVISSEFPPGPGGIGVHAFSLVKSLVRKGWKVSVYTKSDYSSNAEVQKFEALFNNKFSVYREKRKGVFTYLYRFYEAFVVFKKCKTKNIIATGKSSLWIGGVIKLFNPGIQLTAVIHGSEINMTSSLLKAFTQWSMKKADHIVPVSKFTHELLPEAIKQKNCTIIPNGVDLEELSQWNGQSDFKLKGNPAILTVGNVTPRKGQHRVIKALPELKKEFPGIHYNIVGLPTYQNEFEQLADQLEVNDDVTFWGRIPERTHLGACYKEADCFFILSENQSNGDVEGFGIVVLEANYFGLPAIGALGTGVEDAIKNEENGFLVEGDAPREITERLKQILGNGKDYSVGAKKWADKHDWEVIGTQFERFFI